MEKNMETTTTYVGFRVMGLVGNAGVGFESISDFC